ncbi:MAG: hypothetical protein AAF125_01980 [Chloroflexota bacterium]
MALGAEAAAARFTRRLPPMMREVWCGGGWSGPARRMGGRRRDAVAKGVTTAAKGVTAVAKGLTMAANGGAATSCAVVKRRLFAW